MEYPFTIYNGNTGIPVLNEAGFKVIASSYRQIQAAGGVVSNGGGRYLLIHRRGKWDFPKGKIEYGETPPEAALREVEEETGVKPLTLIRELPSTFHIYREKGVAFLKRTFWFEMQTSCKDTPVPQTEEEISGAEWIPGKEVVRFLENSYPSLKELWEKASIFL